MLLERTAILDLGTNTFHIWVINIQGKDIDTLHSEKIPVKIGEGGISQGKISLEAQERIFKAFTYFSEIFEKYQVNPTKVKAVATSAFRSAKNSTEIREKILSQFGVNIQVIDGKEEAKLIYFGVREAIEMGAAKSLIMDIGGGSIEFIIANQEEIFWKESFEIGAQRLLDKFYLTDPIAPEDILGEYNFLEQNLELLQKAIEKYQVKKFIGASGTFDTLVEMDFHRKDENFKELPKDKTKFKISKQSFLESYQEIITKNKEERLTIKGMWKVRVEMIVVASVLLKFIIEKYDFSEIEVSLYALKEGLAFSSFS